MDSQSSFENHPNGSGSAPATSPPLTFTSLPVEILLFILSKVSHENLLSCAQVGLSVNGFITPLIWRTVRINTLDQLDRFKSAEAQHALIRNAHH
ncbi:hypothetical protein BGZ52_008666, partial [Haplosporangium bisporale]